VKNFLLATDGSACSDRATDVAAELVTAFHAKLTVLTVEGSLSTAARGMARAEGQLGDVLDSVARETLRRAKARAEVLGVRHLEVSSAWGDAAELIIDFARKHRSDALVVGRRGRGQLAGLVLGSVSQKLVALAPCIVIVVP